MMALSGAKEERYLGWRDVASMFGCGRNKAMLVMHAIGPIYVGNRMYVRSSDLERKLGEEGEIRVCWR